MSTEDPLEKAVERSATRVAIDAVAKAGFEAGWDAAIEEAAHIVENGLTIGATCDRRPHVIAAALREMIGAGKEATLRSR